MVGEDDHVRIEAHGQRRGAGVDARRDLAPGAVRENRPAGRGERQPLGRVQHGPGQVGGRGIDRGVDLDGGREGAAFRARGGKRDGGLHHKPVDRGRHLPEIRHHVVPAAVLRPGGRVLAPVVSEVHDDAIPVPEEQHGGVRIGFVDVDRHDSVRERRQGHRPRRHVLGDRFGQGRAEFEGRVLRQRGSPRLLDPACQRQGEQAVEQIQRGAGCVAVHDEPAAGGDEIGDRRAAFGPEGRDERRVVPTLQFRQVQNRRPLQRARQGVRRLQRERRDVVAARLRDLGKVRRLVLDVDEKRVVQQRDDAVAVVVRDRQRRLPRFAEQRAAGGRQRQREGLGRLRPPVVEDRHRELARRLARREQQRPGHEEEVGAGRGRAFGRHVVDRRLQVGVAAPQHGDDRQPRPFGHVVGRRREGEVAVDRQARALLEAEAGRAVGEHRQAVVAPEGQRRRLGVGRAGERRAAVRRQGSACRRKRQPVRARDEGPRERRVSGVGRDARHFRERPAAEA